MYLVGKDVAKAGYRAAEHGYYLIVACFDYLLYLYRQFAILVNWMCAMYSRIKTKLGK